MTIINNDSDPEINSCHFFLFFFFLLQHHELSGDCTVPVWNGGHDYAEDIA